MIEDFENNMKTITHRTNGSVVAVYYGEKPTVAELRSPSFLTGDLRNVPLPHEFELVCKQDANAVLRLHNRKDIDWLLTRLSAGKLDGAANLAARVCFIGTLMEARGEDHEQFTNRTRLNPGLNLPSVQWFFQIGPGDTPKNNYFAQKAEDWCVSIFSGNGK